MNFKILIFNCGVFLILALGTSCHIQKITDQFKYNLFDTDSIYEDRKWKLPSSTLALETEFLYPSPSKPIAGKYERFEIGIILPEPISVMVDEFLNNSNVQYPNPYNPEHINIEGFISNGKDTINSYGFYFKDYDRDLKKNNEWKDKPTDYNWRIRFAPTDTGKWTYSIKVTFPNSDIEPIYKSNIEFTCIEKSREGFITVDEDQRHFKFAQTDSAFFVVGQNLAWTDAPIFKGRWLNSDNNEFNFQNKDFHQRLFQMGYLDIIGYLSNVAKNSGNMVRLINSPDSYLFEWEERNVYGSSRNPEDQNFLRQKRAWELDQLFTAAEVNNIKLLFCLEFHGIFNYESNDYYNFSHNPYNHVKNGDVIERKMPQDFFGDDELIKDYKNKMRYFIARWGYSASLGIFQLMNEFDGWGIDSLDRTKQLHSIIKKDVSLQKDIMNWHREIGNYIHQIADRPIIVTNGLKSNTQPFDIPKARNFYFNEGMDMVIHNFYGNDRSVNYTMNQNAQKCLKLFNKPFLFTETGILTDASKNADPNDLESCSDVMFHNFAWSGAVMGSAGTSLNWWQPFDNSRRKNFNALNSFFEKIDFQSKKFIESDISTDNGITFYLCGNLQKLIKKTSMVEVYYVRTTKKDEFNTQEAFGWAHNLSNYWANLDTYRKCPDRNNHFVKVKCCTEDENQEPVTIDTNAYSIKLKGLKSKKMYTIKWYSTRGNGELIKTFTGTTTGSGTIQFNWPGTDHDYAFKLDELTIDSLEKK